MTQESEGNRPELEKIMRLVREAKKLQESTGESQRVVREIDLETGERQIVPKNRSNKRTLRIPFPPKNTGNN